MSLAVIVLNWNHAARTLAAARAVGSWHTLAPDLWVVDNASRPEDVASLAAGLGTARLIRSPVNRGYAGGNNLAIAEALGGGTDYLLLLNADARIEESGVRRLCDALAADPEVGVVGPLLRERHGRRERLYAGGRDIARHLRTRECWRGPTAPAGGELRAADYVPGTVLLARAEAFRRVGLLDEAFFFSGEAADFCRRVRTAGLRCAVCPGVEARHDSEDADGRRDSLYRYYSLRNRFLFVRKHGGRGRGLRIALWLAAGALMYAAALARGRGGRRRAVGLAIADGMAGRYGNRNELFGA